MDDDLSGKEAPSAKTPERAGPGAERSRITAVGVEYQGPLPPPSSFEHYERVLPGAADRILKMAEQQAEHRRLCETALIQAETRSTHLGLIFAFVLGTLGIGGGIYLSLSDHSLAGLTSTIASLGALLGAFIYGRRRESEAEKGRDKQG